MNKFEIGFTKKAEMSRKEKKYYAEEANKVMTGSSIATGLGSLAAMPLQRRMMKGMLKEIEGNPVSYTGDVKGSILKHVEDRGVRKTQMHYQPAQGSMFEETLPARRIKVTTLPVSPKTRSKMRELGELAESFKDSHKLHDVKFKFSPGPKGGDYYNPMSHKVNSASADAAIALHELGHAADYRGSAFKTIGRKILGHGMTAAVPLALAYGDVIKDKVPGSVDDKVVSFMQNNPVSVGLAGYGVSTLYPEAKASYLALKHIKSKQGMGAAMKAFKGRLGPAFGTYAAGAIPVAAGLAISKYIYSRKKKKPENIKTAATPASAFLAGFLGLGLPAAAVVGYRLGSEGGKAVGEVQRYEAEQKMPFQYQKNIRRKTDRFLEEHPVTASVAAGTIVGALGGAALSSMVGM